MPTTDPIRHADTVERLAYIGGELATDEWRFKPNKVE